MSRKTYTLISTITTAVATCAAAIVSYFQPAHATAILGSITAVEGCILTVLGEFTKTAIEKGE